MQNDVFYSLEEASEKLKTTPRYLRDKIKSKKLRAFKLGKRYYLFHSDIAEFIRESGKSTIE